MSRFNVGEQVFVKDLIFCKFTGRTGTVVETILNARGTRTLDRYRVQFEGEVDSVVLWDIQLQLFPHSVDGNARPTPSTKTVHAGSAKRQAA